MDRFKAGVKGFLDSNKARAILITSALSCFFCYFYLCIYGHAGPDSVAEGVHYYRNADWATSCARWMIRYLNIFCGKNVIIPFIVVIAYCLMIAVSCIFLADILKLKKVYHHVLMAAALISFPVIADQFGYLYMALSYSFSFFCVVLGVWLIRSLKPVLIAFSVPVFLMMIGSFQAYIAGVAALGLIMFMLDMLREEKQKLSWLRLGLTAASALIACLINFPVSSLMMNIYHVAPADRVGAFSIGSIIENLSFTLKYSYIWFFDPFIEQTILFKNKLYVLFFILLAVLSVIAVIACVKKKRVVQAVIAVLAFLLIPLAMNVCVVLFPSNGIYNVMRYQYALIFPLGFALLEMMTEGVLQKALNAIAALAVFILVCTYALSANSTWILNKLIYDHTIRQTELMLARIYELDGFNYRETPIVLGGAIEYDDLRGIYAQMFEYSRIGGGPVFWEDPYGMTTGRYHYFREYLGMDARWIGQDEYLAVVRSPEFEDMPVWPAKGSVAMIDGYAVVKNSATPPGVE